jgi:hypothetical protein
MEKSVKQLLKKRPILKYVLELLTIVAGISISFAIENWREDLQEEKIYRTILEEFVLDLKEDSTRYSYGVDYRIYESELIIRYLQGEELTNLELRKWFHVVGGRRLEIKQQAGGYTHWQNAPGITFQSPQLALAIGNYYDGFHKSLQLGYEQEVDFYIRAQNFLVNNPTSILASFTIENDKRFPDNFFNILFTPEVEAEYRALSKHKTMRYMAEAKLFIISNERQMYKRGIELSTALLEQLYAELKRTS